VIRGKYSFIVQLVPGGGTQRIDQCLGPQRRAANAEHQDVVVGLAHAFGKALDARDRFRLVPEGEEAVLAFPAPGLDFTPDLGKPPGQIVQPGAGQPVLAIQLVGEHPAVVQLHGSTSRTCPS
jgi:hypothetical protein